MATLLITSMSGIVGAAYDEDGNYVEDVPAYVNEEFVYVVYPYDISAVFATSYAEPFDGSASFAYGDADWSTITSAYTDMTVPGVQGLGAEEE